MIPASTGLLLALVFGGCSPDASEVGPVGSGSGSGGGGDSGDTDDPTDDTASPTDDTGGSGDDTGDSGEPVIDPPHHPAVVLFIGDGMGFEHVRGGSLFATGAEGGLTMDAAPYKASVITASYTGYTDSAAAASALATGHKTWNGVLGMDRSVEPVPNILEQAREVGLATGVVSTDELTGASPSAFVVHVPNRGDKDAIIADWLANLPDVSFGGGALNLGPAFVESGTNVVFSAEELADSDPAELPIVGLFSEITFPYVADGYEEHQPSLAELVDAALTRLETDEEGFVLVVEGARIDHASHFNQEEKVHAETAAFDEAIAVAVARLESWEGRDTAILVTADHECGGIAVGEGGAAGEIPDTTWRWGDHTNADVPLYAWGEVAAGVDGQRIDNTAIYTLLEAALLTSDPTLPERPSVPDGDLDDLGSAVVTQTWETDFGAGYTQLDGLRLSADDWGLKVGLDGVFNDHSDSVLVWIDRDYGAGSGVGADLVLADTDGLLDILLTALTVDAELPGLGFDAAVGQMRGTYVRLGSDNEEGGLRHFSAHEGAEADLAWGLSVVNFDSGNLAADSAAVDAAGTGLTEHGLEAWIPWSELYGESGLPAEGATLAVFAQALNDDASTLSNQALPPYASDAAPSADSVPVAAVVTLEVDGDGLPLGGASLAP